jgi:hypothetical protein
MRSPDQLRQRLTRQWQDGELRETRLLDSAAWPVRLPIGRPAPGDLLERLPEVRGHIQAWRAVEVGEVVWQAVRYRSAAEAVEVPAEWWIRSPEEWGQAMEERALRQEVALLTRLLARVEPVFRPLLVRQRQLVLGRGVEEAERACAVAALIRPGMAQGRPLRALSVGGCDSKFFERNRALLIRLLEARFGAEALEGGLESFLGAEDAAEHWLLVAPLEPGLLPFRRQRVRAAELAVTPLPGSHLLVVENERALHQLPALPGTIAVLGAGLNLGWLRGAWVEGRAMAYWGDLDTWGLLLLASARACRPAVTPLLMDRATFDRHAAAHAVAEPVPAGPQPPEGLTPPEDDLYRHLLGLGRGRLEQEFLPMEEVRAAVTGWRHAS